MPLDNATHPRPPLPAPFGPDDDLPSPSYPASLPVKSVCRIVRQITNELVALLEGRVLVRRDHRRTACHVRQISMYVCHVVLRLNLSDVGAGFGRDRSTVTHACHTVEDRRDDAAFDAFVATVERMVSIVFVSSGIHAYD